LAFGAAHIVAAQVHLYTSKSVAGQWIFAKINSQQSCQPDEDQDHQIKAE
jgi:hypothetical protein